MGGGGGRGEMLFFLCHIRKAHNYKSLEVNLEFTWHTLCVCVCVGGGGGGLSLHASAD